MKKTAQNTTNSLTGGQVVEQTSIDPAGNSGLSNISGVTAAEFRGIKDEKLAAIRLAMANGDYDSDAILEKALRRMLERLEESENEQ
ncbi:MAG: hypothetical protein H7Z17_08025 [Fuerstia sp.]|nr:hypothetical protein [Fuerstiella sp.]